MKEVPNSKVLTEEQQAQLAKMSPGQIGLLFRLAEMLERPRFFSRLEKQARDALLPDWMWTVQRIADRLIIGPIILAILLYGSIVFFLGWKTSQPPTNLLVHPAQVVEAARDYLNGELTDEGGFRIEGAGLPSVLRVSSLGVTQDLPQFEIEYWDGNMTTFYAPAEVWEPVLIAAEKHGCDPLLVIAVAHSESHDYDNTEVSSAGAAGVWQFTPETWATLWDENPPSRTDIPAAADAACRHIHEDLGLDAEETRAGFISNFTGADGSWAWNQHAGQADYVWRLWQELRRRNTELVELGTSENPYSEEFVFDFDQAASLLEDLITGFEIVGDQHALALPYREGTYVITQEQHGANYGHAAMDIAGGDGTPLYSPCNCVVVDVYTDIYGNPTLVLENDEYIVVLLHGNYTVETRDVLKLGDLIGTESNQGYTFSDDRYCGTGSTCGYHTHFNVYLTDIGESVYPGEIVNTTIKGDR